MESKAKEEVEQEQPTRKEKKNPILKIIKVIWEGCLCLNLFFQLCFSWYLQL